MHFLKKLIPKSEFFNNVLKLFSSTVVAGLIQSGALVIITRFYSKGDIGNYQLLLSIFLIFGMVASLKYELAIVLQKKETDKNHLTIISFLVLFTTTIISLIIFYSFDQTILKLLKAEVLSEFVLLIPVGIFFTGLLQICRYILIGNKLFGDLAKNKIYQTVSTQGIAIGWGLWQPNFIGLFAGYILGIIIPVWIVLSKKLFNLKNFSLSTARALMAKYKKFPMINTVSAFLNNFSIQLPVFMFSKFYNEDILGLYTVANLVTVMPINLIATSVSQVYFQAASEKYQTSTRELLGIYKQTIKKLTLIGLAPLTAMVAIVPYLMGFIFGKEWIEAGVYIQIISFGVYFRFINIPIGTTFSIIDRQEIALILIGASVAIRFMAMYIFRESVIGMLWGLSVSTAVFYAVYNFLVYWYLRKEIKKEESSVL